MEVGVIGAQGVDVGAASSGDAGIYRGRACFEAPGSGLLRLDLRWRSSCSGGRHAWAARRSATQAGGAWSGPVWVWWAVILEFRRRWLLFFPFLFCYFVASIFCL
ncbi:hypothetical protein RJT34_06141 [Clitoria ternatea]|uniref:Uncharacterized protein n=1 Tax=Clitoria ternatea TaxID=43366 RepID=A0AAN9PSY8_CLITE